MRTGLQRVAGKTGKRMNAALAPAFLDCLSYAITGIRDPAKYEGGRREGGTGETKGRKKELRGNGWKKRGTYKKPGSCFIQVPGKENIETTAVKQPCLSLSRPRPSASHT